MRVSAQKHMELGSAKQNIYRSKKFYLFMCLTLIWETVLNCQVVREFAHLTESSILPWLVSM